MLNLTIECAMRLHEELRIELTGGSTETIFPLVEHWLQEDGDHWKALKYIGSAASMNRYRSVVDYLYAQVVPERRKEVFRYYLSNEEHDMAKAILTVAERNLIQSKMLVACEVAYQLWCSKRRANWATVRECVAELAA